jgi:N-formylglutamate amidohydrolase
MSPTFSLHEPKRPSPVVVSVPHAGTVVPDVDAPLLAVNGSALLRDADLHVDKLAAGVVEYDVAVLIAQVSRYIVDINRAPDDVDREVCAELTRPARPSARGLCWRATTDGVAVLRRPLTLRELDDRRARIHTPYHEALERLLEERRRAFGFAVLLDLHSMPSLGRPLHNDPGGRRADIVPGDVRGASCAAGLTRLVSEHFAARGFSVKENDPYMGGYITRHHGRPQRGVHAIQVEVNRDLYMDEVTYAYRPDRAARVERAIADLVGAVVAFDPR